jgi:cytidylate kinase
MNAELGLERCLGFIHCQLHPANAVTPGSKTEEKRWRVVTISRQAGSGGHSVAGALVEYLRAGASRNENHPWMVFDRNLVGRVLEEHHLPQRLVRFMPEDRISETNDVLDELFRLHPASPALVEKTAETILGLAKLGNVILIGRGANVVTRGLDYAFHVRLVGSLDKRAEYIQKSRGLEKRAALEFIAREDLGRRRYLRKYYGKDIDDPLLYHMVINTDLTVHRLAAATIARVLLSNGKDLASANDNLRAV